CSACSAAGWAAPEHAAHGGNAARRRDAHVARGGAARRARALRARTALRRRRAAANPARPRVAEGGAGGGRGALGRGGARAGRAGASAAVPQRAHPCGRGRTRRPPGCAGGRAAGDRDARVRDARPSTGRPGYANPGRARPASRGAGHARRGGAEAVAARGDLEGLTMLTSYDDYPIHQNPEPVAHPGTGDRNFYDRYFFNGYSRAGDLFFAAALGVYPNRRVMDAAFSVVRDGQQHVVRASRLAPLDRRDTRVGPIFVEVLEPLRALHLRASDNDFGLSADLAFYAR